MKAVNARYVYGLTATPFRQDGHQPILFMQCGPIRYTADAKDQMKSQNFSRLLVCESMYRKRLKGYASIGYRIRNNEMFDNLFPTTDVIYDGHSFEQPFITDLAKAKNSVVISCPRMNIGRHLRIVERLVDLAANGIDIVLYTKEENEDTLRLQHQGISVMLKEQLSLHAAIIDKSIIWYGSVNILGFHSIEDNLIRFKNPEIATSLLESLQK